MLFTRYVVTAGLHDGPAGGALGDRGAPSGMRVLSLWGWTVLPGAVARTGPAGWKDAVLAAIVVALAWAASRGTDACGATSRMKRSVRSSGCCPVLPRRDKRPRGG